MKLDIKFPALRKFYQGNRIQNFYTPQKILPNKPATKFSSPKEFYLTQTPIPNNLP